MTTPNPDNVKPWYLRNITEALALDEATGNVFIRTGIEGNIIITGNVNIPGEVTVNSTAEDPVHVHLDEIGTSGILSVPWMPVSIDGNSAVTITSGNIKANVTGSTVSLTGNLAGITSNVNIGTMPNVNAVVSGTVAVSGITGNIAGITSLPPITGNVNANITGGNVTVNQGTNPWTVNGTVNIGTIPEVEIKNDSGNPIPVEWTYGDGATLIPWNVQVGRGLIPGVQGLSISGYSSNVGTSFIPAWEDGAYVYFNTAQQVRVWSESASDTNVSVLVSGLDASYNILTETVVLTNGVTGVLTTGNFLRVNSMSLTRVPQNVGRLHAGNSDKSITLAYIGTATNNSAGRSQMSVYTVPAGYTFYLTQSNWYTNQTGSQTALYRSWTQSPAGLITIVLTFPMQQQYNSTKVVPRPYPEKTDIQWQVASSSGTSNIGGQIEGYLIANS